MNFLTENNLTTYEDLETAANKIHSDFDNTTQKIKAVEKTIGENAMLIKQLEIYRQYRSIYLKLQKVKQRKLYTEIPKRADFIRGCRKKSERQKSAAA